MTILVLYLTQNNHVLLPVIAAGLCSLLLGIVFVLYLPILIEKNYHDHWGMCIAYSSVGSVYMLVEVLAMIGAVPSFFEDNKGLVAIGILTYFVKLRQSLRRHKQAHPHPPHKRQHF